MGTLLFGTDESISCLQHVEFQLEKGESLCLGHKTTIHFFGAGAYMTDDGYVLAVENTGKITNYYPLEAGRITEMQNQSLLPKALPAYHIAWYQWAWGYSLWILLALGVVWSLVKSRLKTRAAESLAAEAAATAVSYGPPEVKTKVDRYVTDHVAPLLEPGERVQQQAWVLDRIRTGGFVSALQTHAFVAVLTDRRLLLLGAKGAWKGIAIKQGKLESIARSRIVRVAVDFRTITVGLDDGSTRTMWVDPMGNGFLSSQQRFLLDVPRILAPGGAVAVANG